MYSAPAFLPKWYSVFLPQAVAVAEGPQAALRADARAGEEDDTHGAKVWRTSIVGFYREEHKERKGIQTAKECLRHSKQLRPCADNAERNDERRS